MICKRAKKVKLIVNKLILGLKEQIASDKQKKLNKKKEINKF